VIHAVHSNNMSDMGGLRKDMPRTFWTFVIGSLSLAGIIPLAGFFSKDEILATLDYEGYTAFMWVAIAGAFVTAFYMTRAVALTFFGTYKGHGHPHESPALMTVPLVLLAVPSGARRLPQHSRGHLRGLRELHHLGGGRVVPMGDHHPEAIDWTSAAYGWRRVSRHRARLDVVRTRLREPGRPGSLRDPGAVPAAPPEVLHGSLALGYRRLHQGSVGRAVDWINTYVIDGIVNGVGGGVRLMGRFVYGGLDQRGIDMIFNGVSAGADTAGAALRKLQTGRVQQYAMGFVVGALVLVLAIAVFN
jgi:NADH-quinone oxidoreductase subunit L